MESNLQIFNNSEFGALEVLMIDGKPYFPATECAKILGYAKPHDAISRHCRYSAKHGVPHPQSRGKTIEVNFIPEGDLYRLITQSKLPGAERFESWVFDEVLPSIREHGAYITTEKLEQVMNDPDSWIDLMTKLKNERTLNAQLQLEAEENAPKVQLAEAITATNDTILVGEFAKILRGNGIEIGERRLYERLRKEGYLIKRPGRGQNVPTQLSMELGLFELEETVIPIGGGRTIVSKTPRVTGKGQRYFIERYLKEMPESRVG